ncbi:hypothetical protein TWF718_009896 [Orbilia javanica]|uniref:Uncharacterized protein n=1 Tax=Orbilia javanica TaxID=47235 RepID=A0AAN8N0F8_9PEZI
MRQNAKEDAKITLTISNRGGILSMFASVTRRRPLSEVPSNQVSGDPTELQSSERASKPRRRLRHETEGGQGNCMAITDLSGYPKWIAINSPLGREIEAARCKAGELHSQISRAMVASPGADKFSQRGRKRRASGSNGEPAPKKRRH